MKYQATSGQERYDDMISALLLIIIRLRACFRQYWRHDEFNMHLMAAHLALSSAAPPLMIVIKYHRLKRQPTIGGSAARRHRSS